MVQSEGMHVWKHAPRKYTRNWRCKPIVTDFTTEAECEERYGGI